MSRRVQYLETPCKSALNRVEGMPFRWSLNPYRGCVHACHYCYARATHAYQGMNADEDFETRILVKVNLPEVLRRELARPTWTGERVAIGTATDPYQPGEGRYRITRRAIEALEERRNPFGVVTKSTLVLRDLDLLTQAARRTDVAVSFTVTTLDPRIWRAVEPGTPPPAKRLEVLRRLVEAGVPAGVYLAPVLPGLTDSVEALEAVAAAARVHGAAWLWASPLRLAPLVKEHYLGFIARSAPELLHRYERAYAAGANAPVAYRDALAERIARVRARHGFDDASEPRRTAPAPAVAETAPASMTACQLSLELTAAG